MSGPTVRFAPSPTGFLHVGNIRAALFNWLYARRHGGRFILRLDDTDRQRSKPEYEAAIERDLSWLGLAWDARERQSDRLAHYDAARDRLIAASRLYPCYETPEELELRRKIRLSRRLPPVYGREALKLTGDIRSQRTTVRCAWARNLCEHFTTRRLTLAAVFGKTVYIVTIPGKRLPSGTKRFASSYLAV